MASQARKEIKAILGLLEVLENQVLQVYQDLWVQKVREESLVQEENLE